MPPKGAKKNEPGRYAKPKDTKGKDKKKKKEKVKKRKLKNPKFSPFNLGLLYTEFWEDFIKCDKDSSKLVAIPMKKLPKAMRMTGLMPSEKLICILGERMEMQEPLRTPPPSDEEEEEEEEEEVEWTEEELELRNALRNKTPSQILAELKAKKKEERRMSKKLEAEAEYSADELDAERPSVVKRKKTKAQKKQEREEEEERLREEAERIKAEEEERIRLEEEEAERLRLEEEGKKKKPKRELIFPKERKKNEIKKVAKMRIRFKHFVKWKEFANAVALYEDKQYKGWDLMWAFMTLDPNWDYELEPTWYYGAENPLVPNDEIANGIPFWYTQNRQERFIEKEAKRFIKMADFKKEGFFNYKELISDMCYECNYDMGKPPKKKKSKVKES